jgi:4-hydroxy-2-oxoheptanedioate aldolase
MAEIIQLEQKLECCLVQLKEKFGLRAVKAEFEAEGASFRDISRLRRLTARHNILLYLKIGGVEALRDIKDAFEIGVDGLVAPMVESPFGVIKFTQAVESIFSDQKIFKSINIETCNAVECIDEILDEAQGKIDNITIGRTDLSQSYLDPEIQPDSEFIFDLIKKLSQKVYAFGLALTVGGSVTKDSIGRFKKVKEIWEGRSLSIETRKIVLPVEDFLKKKEALEEALKFEEFYICSKLETERLLSKADRDRLDKLKLRI